MKNKVMTLGTKANGGIKSVVENYISSGLYKSYSHEWIETHGSDNLILNQLIFFTSIIKALYYRNKGFKICHMHMSMYGSFYRKYILSNILRLFKTKIILHLHGSEFKVFYKNSKNKKWISNLFESADSTIVLSEGWNKFITEIAPKARVTTINNYVNEIDKYERSVTGTFSFLFMGAIGKRKGIFDLLKTFENLADEFSNVELHIAGNDDKNELPELLKMSRHCNRIKFHGWINHQQKTELLNSSSCLILPSYNEGLPMVIIEAMSAKIPVISTYVGGIPDAITNDENGLLIEPGNEEQMKTAMIKIMDPSVSQSISTSAYDDYKKLYSPEAIIPKVNAIYEELSK